MADDRSIGYEFVFGSVREPCKPQFGIHSRLLQSVVLTGNALETPLALVCDLSVGFKVLSQFDPRGITGLLVHH